MLIYVVLLICFWLFRGILSMNQNDKELIFAVKGGGKDCESQDEPGEVLLIEGPTSGDVFVNGKAIVLERSSVGLDGKDHNTGVSTWDGSRKLALYLNDHADLVKGKTCLELGAGTGVGGLAALLLDAKHVVLTDLEYTLPQLEANVRATVGSDASALARVETKLVDWTDPSTYPVAQGSHDAAGYDILLAADVAWLDHLVDPLVKTIRALVNPGTVLLLAHQSRSKEVDKHLFGALGEFLDVVPLHQDGKISIYRGRLFAATMVS